MSQSEFIFYIRHPLATAESGFHQEVKRHKRTKPLEIDKDLGFNNLVTISEIAKEFDCKIHFRYFDEAQFEGKTLLSDFSACLPANIPSPSEVKRLNTQYSPGAISLMRCCNEFADESLLRELDTYLQKESEKESAFSFISENEFFEVQKIICGQVDNIAKRYSSINSDKLKKLVENYKIPPTCTKEKINIDILRLLKNAPESVKKKLYMQVRDKASAKVKELIISGMAIGWPQRVYYSLLKMFDKF